MQKHIQVEFLKINHCTLNYQLIVALRYRFSVQRLETVRMKKKSFSLRFTIYSKGALRFRGKLGVFQYIL